MCGIAGMLLGEARASGTMPADLKLMRDAIRHRGPDDAGLWTDAQVGIGLAHRRLAVLDLTEAGAQPMLSADDNLVLCFNGEVYNHLEIRRELEERRLAPRWRGHSDTESILAGFSAWGVPETLRRMVGMFAIALWNKAERTLWLARDRTGEKPLYYTRRAGQFCFGSELKALQQSPQWTGEIDREALAFFIQYGYVGAPRTIFANTYKVLPGEVVRVTVNGVTHVPYWSAADLFRGGAAFDGTEPEAKAELARLLQASVSGQLVADVPVGAFLSGGIDSSLIVALMQSQSKTRVKTFTIGFSEALFDEAQHARAVANSLGTEHHELYVSPADAMSVIPDLPRLYDEPLGDSSQIPTYLVARLARTQVTVALSGDGGDEIFGGYNRYSTALSLGRAMDRLPRAARLGATRVLRRIPALAEGPTLRRLWRSLHIRGRAITTDRILKWARMLDVDALGLYETLVSSYDHLDGLVLGSTTAFYPLTDRRMKVVGLADLQALDFETYLPDDILMKVDRAAMAVSLETRVPLLDHRVIAFAASLPTSMKIRNRTSKWILREVLADYVPRHLFERPKMGFSVPLGAWLRGPLRPWAEDLLDDRRVLEEGYFDPLKVQDLWEAHLSGKSDNASVLWNILTFQSWFRYNTCNIQAHEIASA